ncbi:unnamed protein product [Mycetohabitans rhizoxinica HKI 454]|uniref:Uncharacterized protein n=1 Tax=Mycetohabitans rhizoxinica (strain DSM 19002 / CIP 109453 / HKI 454) TaxID=882378 RepID=E5ARG8_MYCRK|nr:unnamed protein product [Mycetohabitans rhizoxinica HKI 454]
MAIGNAGFLFRVVEEKSIASNEVWLPLGACLASPVVATLSARATSRVISFVDA